MNNLINARIETLKLTIDVPGQTIDDAMSPGLEDALPEIDDNYQKSRTRTTFQLPFCDRGKTWPVNTVFQGSRILVLHRGFFRGRRVA